MTTERSNSSRGSKAKKAFERVAEKNGTFGGGRGFQGRDPGI